jgi:hypothetical protein
MRDELCYSARTLKRSGLNCATNTNQPWTVNLTKKG